MKKINYDNLQVSEKDKINFLTIQKIKIMTQSYLAYQLGIIDKKEAIKVVEEIDNDE